MPGFSSFGALLLLFEQGEVRWSLQTPNLGFGSLLLNIVGATSRVTPAELPQNEVVAIVDQPARKSSSKESVRQSVSLPSRIAKRVRTLADVRNTTASRVLVDLIETGLQTKQAQHKRFFELTDQLAEAKDPAERKRLQEELARISCCK